MSLGEDVRKGGFLHGGWAELVGVSYERRMYAFRFDTTEAQDVTHRKDERVRKPLRTFNCSSIVGRLFARRYEFLLSTHVRPQCYSRRGHDDSKTDCLQACEVREEAPRDSSAGLRDSAGPRISARHGRSNKSIAESLVTTGYAIPIAILEPVSCRRPAPWIFWCAVTSTLFPRTRKSSHRNRWPP